MTTLLIVEDHTETADVMVDYVRTFFPAWDISREITGKGAIEKIIADPPDVVILDIALADAIDGLEVVRRVAAADKKTRFILVTALGNRAFRGPKPGRPWLDQLHDNEKALVAHFFEKSYNWKTFLKAIAEAAGGPVPPEIEKLAEF